MKIWIVSGRVDTDILFPRVFKTKREAEIEVEDIIYESAKEVYEWQAEDAVYDLNWDVLEEWACDNGYSFDFYDDRGVFDDGNEHVEVEITEHNIEIDEENLKEG